MKSHVIIYLSLLLLICSGCQTLEPDVTVARSDDRIQRQTIPGGGRLLKAALVPAQTVPAIIESRTTVSCCFIITIIIVYRCWLPVTLYSIVDAKNVY
jgi:hypothetical protein